MTHVDLNMEIIDEKSKDNLESTDNGLDVSDEHYIGSDQESYELHEAIEVNGDALESVANSITDDVDHPGDIDHPDEIGHPDNDDLHHLYSLD